MTLRALGLLVCALLAAPSLARADDADTAARARAAASFRAGQGAFERGDFAQAATFFEAADRLSPHPATLLNAAEAWELAGQPARAAEACDAVLSRGAGAFAVSARTRLARLGAKIATVELSGSPEWTLRIDEGDELHPPLVRRLLPGKHEVRATAPRRARRAFDLHAGQELRVRADDLPADPVDPPRVGASPERPRPGPPLGTWVSLALGAASLSVAGYFGAQTLASQDDFSRSPTEATRDAFYRNKTITNVALGVTAGAAAAALVLWVALPRGPVASVGARASATGITLMATY